MKRKRMLLIAGAIGLASIVSWIVLPGRNAAKISPYVTAPVSRGDIRQVVSATGTLQAVTTVLVGSQISGTISRLHADFNSKVKKGQVIAELDQSKFKAKVDEEKANVLAAGADLSKAKVSLEDARRVLARAKELNRRELISQSELDTAQTAFDAAGAQLESSKAKVSQAGAALNQAAVDLAYTIIHSPVDGVVISRNVDVGQTVAASLQAPTLFTIANDLAKMEVHTNVDEADIGNIWAGQDVTFTVDAYPARRFKGKVSQVRHAPTVVQNVVTYDAVVGISNDELILKPGMTANVQFLVKQQTDVLRISNAALRFRPEGNRSGTPRPTAGTPRPNREGARGGGRRSGDGERRQGGSGERGERRSTIYILNEHAPTAVEVRLGISDGTYTELVDGNLKEGQEVILSVNESAKSDSGSGILNLFRVRGGGGFR